VVQNTGLKPFSARKQAVIHQGKLRGFFLKLVKNTREKLVLPRKILARVPYWGGAEDDILSGRPLAEI
jgi:hypothetical protein